MLDIENRGSRIENPAQSMSSLSPKTAQTWSGVDMTDPLAVVTHAMHAYGNRIALASSFSLEDAIMIDLMAKVRKDLRVFALDTGRLDPETYECAEAIRRRYKVNIDWYFPRHDAVEQLERQKGLFSFRESVENRKECCHIRKVEPLSRALQGLEAWVTGLRREQSVTRAELQVIEMDAGHGGIVKINPLSAWTLEDCWTYARQNKLPYNTLYDQGYTSIGCAPCTRAIKPGEDQRAGRWWWESPDHKECGLHIGGKFPQTGGYQI
jgi:phosphoadenosine phosphosulfate reductase